MNWIKRKFSNYVKPFLFYFYNSIVFISTPKESNTIILLADFDRFGGTRTYFEQICKFLKQENKNVICLVTERQKDLPFLKLIEEVGFAHVIIPDEEYVVEYRGAWSCKLYSYYLNKLLARLNLFILICVKYKPASLFISSGEPEKWLYLLWLPVSKIVYVLHTLPYKSIGKIGKYTLKAKLSANKPIVTVSEFAKTKISQHWQLSKRQVQHITVIYNFLKPLFKEELEKKENFIRVLTVGHVEAYKNPFFFIEVAQSVLSKVENKRIEFVWAGDGSLLYECINSIGEISVIRFLGYRQDIEQLYLESDIYFQPSVIESHGIAVVGAMCYSLPCVVSNVGGLQESIINEYNGYTFSLENQKDAVTKLLDLINDKWRRKEMGDKGRERFMQLFSETQWQKKMQQFIA